MPAATFDTLAAARDMERAGMDRAQAEAVAAAMRAAAEADRGALATLADLAGLEARMYRALLLQGVAIAGIVIAALKLL